MGYSYDMSGTLTMNKRLTREQLEKLQAILSDEKCKDGQPSRYCPWQLDVEREGDEVTDILKPNDEVSLSDNFNQWLPYLLTNFFIPWGIVLNGEIYSSGSDAGGDWEKTVVTDNRVNNYSGDIVYEDTIERMKALIFDLQILHNAGMLDKYVGIQARLAEFEQKELPYL